MAECTDPCCCCGEPYDDVNPEYSLCYGCLEYHNIQSNICVLCENDGTPLHASRFWDNLHATEKSDLYIFCSQSCRAQFNFRYCWAQILGQHSHAYYIWCCSWQWSAFSLELPLPRKKALLIPLLPTLSMTHLAHDLPYHKSTIITKLKEPTVLLTKKSRVNMWFDFFSAILYPGKKPEMNLRTYLYKFDIVP